METFVTIVLFLISLGITLWPLRWIAQWLEAGRTGYGACLLALVVPTVLGGIAVLAVGAIGMHPLLGLPIVLVIELIAFAKILDTTMLRALGIAVLTTIVAVVLMLGFFMLLGLFFGGLGLGALGLAALFGGAGALQGFEDMARFEPKTDSAIVSQEAREDGTVVTRYEDGTVQTMRITEQGGFEVHTQGPSSTSGRGAIPQATALPDPARARPRERPPAASQPRPRYTMTYVEGERASLPAYEGRRLRVTLRNGIQHEGTMHGAGAGEIVIKRRLRGGSVEFTVPTADIQRIEVWSRTAG